MALGGVLRPFLGWAEGLHTGIKRRCIKDGALLGGVLVRPNSTACAHASTISAPGEAKAHPKLPAKSSISTKPAIMVVPALPNFRSAHFYGLSVWPAMTAGHRWPSGGTCHTTSPLAGFMEEERDSDLGGSNAVKGDASEVAVPMVMVRNRDISFPRRQSVRQTKIKRTRSQHV